jgi:multiple sugar transport system permease protein
MNPKRIITSIAIHFGLVVVAFFATGPLLWMLSASLMPDMEATRLPPRLWPENINLIHYKTLFSQLNLLRYMGNSFVLASAVTLLSLLFNSLAGYAFAKLHFSGRAVIFRGLMAAMVIPGQVAMLPLFLMLRDMGLVNTYLGVIVPGMASIFGIFLIRQYARSIPDALLDAARIDGASELRIYWSLVLPLCRPILVTMAVFSFMGSWNDFMWPLIILTDDNLYTLPVALAGLMGEHAQDMELMMAGAVITLLPVMLIFLSLQRFYIQGLILGSLKG